MLITYIRKNKTDKSKGIPIGCVVALDKNHIGWSLCNPKDKWNRKRGLEIATGRAKNNNTKDDIYKKLWSNETIKTDNRICIEQNIHIYGKSILVLNAYNYIKQKAEVFFKE